MNKLNGVAATIESNNNPNNNIESLPDRIAETFTDHTILLTGGTGFVGKVFLEKILRVAYGLNKIYVLVRKKYGKDARDRIKDMFNNPIFDLVKSQRGLDTILNIVEPIEGDVLQPDLGISVEDRTKITENVTLIVHAAATVRFDESLKFAVLMNARGTKLMIQLAKDCRHLKMFHYVSTAFCHSYIQHLEEKSYDPPADPDQIIKLVENFDDELIERLTPKLLYLLPNTYAFSKALAEAIVLREFKTLPVLISRPSIILPLLKDPIPGWIDNINGPVGLLIGAGKGVIRTMVLDDKTCPEVITADIFVNAMLILFWSYLVNGKTEHTVFNITSSSEFQITWKEILDYGRRTARSVLPFNYCAWYPGGTTTTSPILHKICVILFQFIPAIFYDIFLRIIGYQPVVLRAQRRILKGYDVVQYYVTHQWDFSSKYAQEIRKDLNPRERRKYKVDAENLDIDKYFYDCVLSSRRYVLNEPDDTIPAAKRHMKILYVLDTFFKLAILLYFIWKMLKLLQWI